MKSLKIKAIKTFIQLQILKTQEKKLNPAWSDNVLQGKEDAFNDILQYIKELEEME